MVSISIFITGGTIDKSYNQLEGELFFSNTYIPEIIKHSRTTLNIHIEELMLVDSLEMTATQRETIVNSCVASKQEKIIITHGTDTMVETATEIARKNLDKIVILTGAMIPYSIEKTDAVFNLASSLAYAQTLENGVYVVMNGHYFNWDNVKKNKDLGVFQTL